MAITNLANLDATRGIKLDNKLAQHALGTFLGKAGLNAENESPVNRMRTKTSDWESEVQTPIQYVDVGPAGQSKGTTRFTKYKLKHRTSGFTSGMGSHSWSDVDVVGENEFTFFADVFHAKPGWEVRPGAYQNVVTIKDWVKIQMDMERWVSSFFLEIFLARAAGRIGKAEDWSVITEGETATGTGDSVKTGAGHYAWLNNGNVMKEPTEIWCPSVSNLKSTPVNDHSGTTQPNGKINLAWLRKVNLRLRQLSKKTERGISWERPAIKSPKAEYATMMGGRNRISSKEKIFFNGLAMCGMDALNVLKEDAQWIKIQEQLTLKFGTETGFYTGIVGDYDGLGLCDMRKVVEFSPASGVNVQRGFIFGKEAMMEVVQSIAMPPNSMRNNIKQYMKTIAQTPTPVNVRVGELQTGLASSIQMSVYYSPIQQRFKVNHTSPHGHTYDEVGNLIAFDLTY